MSTFTRTVAGLAVASSLVFATASAKADCFDYAYNQYVTHNHLAYTLVGTRNDGAVGSYTRGEFAAVTGTLFRSGPRGGSEVYYNFYLNNVGVSSWLLSGGLSAAIDFSTKQVRLTANGFSYSVLVAATCVSPQVMSIYDGFNAYVMSFYGSN